MSRWDLFEVEVADFGASILSAPSRGAALYSRYLDFRDPYPDTTFRDWLRIAKVRRVKRAPVADPYAYVRRIYGVEIQHGTRVEIQKEGPSIDGRRGTVVHPGRDSTAYAHVVLDGETRVANVHPFSIKILSEQP